jgi:hypothetical protein
METKTAKQKSGEIVQLPVMSEHEYIDATESYEGFCIYCGETESGIEPDAREYKCEGCGKYGVFGFEELLLMGYVVFREEARISV